MPRFSTSPSLASRASRARTPNTINLAGGTAWAQDPELELASLVTTSMCAGQVLPHRQRRDRSSAPFSCRR